MTSDPTPFAVVHDTEPSASVLRLRGQVDRDAEEHLLRAFAEAVQEGATRVRLDLAATTYINSSGLAALVSLLRDAHDRGIAVLASGLSDHYRHIFEITRLSDLIEIEPVAVHQRGPA